MASLASINIRFSADLKEFSSQMKNAERQLERTGKKLQNTGKNLSLAVTAPFAALSAISLNNFDKQAQAVAQVEAGLRTTGNTAGYTSEQLQKLASDLQGTTLFGDEEILSGATAQLLTFTNIAGEQFARTQQAALDLASRLDGDLKSASIQLGKALNDPVANLSALSRSGIQFSKEQKAVINSLVETGRLAEAQTIILDELEKQYGGSAEAAAKAGTGPLKQLGNQISDLTEDFGALIADAIAPFVERVKNIVTAFQGLDVGTKKVILTIAAFAAALGPAILVLGTLIRNISAIIPLIRALTVAIAANPIGAFAVAVTALAGGLLLANSRLTPLTDATQEFNELTAKATTNIAKEKTELEKYLAIAKNDSISKEEREKAIRKLNAISPKYLGDLTLEKINTEEAKKATDAYIESLLKKAKVEAAQEKLVEVQKKLLDLQLGVNDAVAPSLWQNVGNAINSFGSSSAFAANSVQTLAKNASQEKTELEKLQAQLTSFIGTNEDLNATLDNTTQATVTPVVDLSKTKVKGKLTLEQELENADFSKLNRDLEYTNALLENDSGLKFAQALDAAADVNFDTAVAEAVENVGVSLNQMGEDIALAAERSNEDFEKLVTTAKAVGSAVGSAFKNLGAAVIDSLGLAENGMEGFLKVMFSTVTELLSMLLANAIGNAIVAGSTSATFSGPGAVFTLPTFIATAVAGVLSAFSAIPKFESGGIVPGNSFYGDQILARVNSGELILNQRQQAALYRQLNTTEGTNIVLGGRLAVSGDELQLVLDRATTRRNRRS